jgi:hypothetical protein
LFTKPHGPIQSEFDQEKTRQIIESILAVPDSKWNIRTLQQVAQPLGIAYKKLFHIFRIAIIDNEAGPPVMEIVEFFGVAECRKRLEAQLKWLENEEGAKKIQNNS